MKKHILYGMDVYQMNPRTEQLNKIGTYRVYVNDQFDKVGHIRRKGQMQPVKRMTIGRWFLGHKPQSSPSTIEVPHLSIAR